jgi:hypothetical protein
LSTGIATPCTRVATYGHNVFSSLYSTSLLPYSSFLIFDNIPQNTYESIMNLICSAFCVLRSLSAVALAKEDAFSQGIIPP